MIYLGHREAEAGGVVDEAEDDATMHNFAESGLHPKYSDVKEADGQFR